jgi:hypothetical protein
MPAKPLLLVILLITAGCATQTNKDHGSANANAAGTHVQCHSQRLTGTMIPNTVCTTDAQRNAQQAAVQEIRSAVEIAPQGSHPGP